MSFSKTVFDHPIIGEAYRRYADRPPGAMSWREGDFRLFSTGGFSLALNYRHRRVLNLTPAALTVISHSRHGILQSDSVLAFLPTLLPAHLVPERHVNGEWLWWVTEHGIASHPYVFNRSVTVDLKQLQICGQVCEYSTLGAPLSARFYSPLTQLAKTPNADAVIFPPVRIEQQLVRVRTWARVYVKGKL